MDAASKGGRLGTGSPETGLFGFVQYGDGAVWHRRARETCPAPHFIRGGIQLEACIDAKNGPVSSQPVGSLIDAQTS